MRIGRKQFGMVKEDDTFKSEVLDALSLIPSAHLQGLRGIYIRKLPIIQDFSDYGQEVAFYHPWFQTVNMFMFDSDVLHHEIGHHVYNSILSTDERESIWKMCPGAGSEYADEYLSYARRPTEVFARAYDRLARLGSRLPESSAGITTEVKKYITTVYIPSIS